MQIWSLWILSSLSGLGGRPSWPFSSLPSSSSSCNSGPGWDVLQKEKTVILPPFWAARPAAWFAFAGVPHSVGPWEAGGSHQVRAFGWPEAFSDASQHVGLLSCWHGTDHHVPVYIPAGATWYTADLAWGTGAWWHQEPGCQSGQAVGHSQAAVSWSGGPCGHSGGAAGPDCSCPGGYFESWWPDSLRAGSGWHWTVHVTSTMTHGARVGRWEAHCSWLGN